ncbi:MAG: cob(I)yrinic acid a,c-diamide adenosyltransferase, partial [Rhodothermales bacterium]|nr:cob(I)yrinic acid a,c-diamide adenosyltransferase [Rhodothermales bacterium]
MKIYTGTGDAGKTGILGGNRVAKNHPRIEAYGTVDELNASIGMVLSTDSRGTSQEDIREGLTRIQAELFVLGADLATPLDSRADVPRINSKMIERLETDIDRAEADLEELKSFVLPGGSATAAALHVARTVCRRTERRVVELAEQERINDLNIVYLNRLADLLFVLARAVNRIEGIPDTIW